MAASTYGVNSGETAEYWFVTPYFTVNADKQFTFKATVNKYCNEAILITIKSLAKQLGINITKRKAIQAIPLIGAGVGATMNIAFINDICWAARRSFQERWLIDNGKVQSI